MFDSIKHHKTVKPYKNQMVSIASNYIILPNFPLKIWSPNGRNLS